MHMGGGQHRCVIIAGLPCLQSFADMSASQTILFHALGVLTKAMAPIVPFSAEDIVSHLPQCLVDDDHPISAFRDGWIKLPQSTVDQDFENKWNVRQNTFSHWNI